MSAAVRPLSVLFLNPMGPGEWGGVERWFFDLACGLRDRGHVATAAGRPDSEWSQRADDAGMAVCRVPLRSDFSFPQARTLSRFMRQHGVDVVVTKLHRGIRAGGFAARFAGRPPVVAIMGLVETKRGLHYRMTYRLFLDRVITLSEAMRAEIAARGGLDPDHVAILPQGIRTEAFRVPPGTREAARAALGIAADVPVALGIGRLHTQKRFDLLLTAFAQVVRDLPTARLLIVGEGRLRGDIEAHRAHLGLERQATLLGFRRDIPELMAAADVLVLSSDDEGVPVVALEAMAAGRPVVSTRVGSIEAAVVEGRTGLLVPRGDTAALAVALRSVLAAPDRGASMGAAGRVRAVERFGLERCIADTERYLLSLRR